MEYRVPRMPHRRMSAVNQAGDDTPTAPANDSICSYAAGATAVMPFIVGAPRSGTTLLRLMIDAHPDIAIPPETGFLTQTSQPLEAQDRITDQFFQAVTAFPPGAPAWRDFGIAAEAFHTRLRDLRPFSVADGYRLFYRMYAERFGKPRWGDKTPLYCRYIPQIRATLPEARFIHVVRDGRDVAASLRKQWFSPGHEIEVLARFWRENVEAARRHRGDDDYLEIRFEDLVQAPEEALRRVCTFIELQYHPDMGRYHLHAADRLQEHQARLCLDGSVLVTHERRLEQQKRSQQPPDPSQIGIGQRELSADDLGRFEEIAGDLLRACGYSLINA